MRKLSKPAFTLNSVTKFLPKASVVDGIYFSGNCLRGGGAQVTHRYLKQFTRFTQPCGGSGLSERNQIGELWDALKGISRSGGEI